MIKAVIFDVDGVLVDSFDANVEYFKRLFSAAGYVPPTKEEYQHMFHLPVKDMVNLIAKNPGKKEFERIMEIEKTVDYPIEKMKLAEKSKEIVKKLSKKYTLAIVTGRNEEGVEEYLKYSSLEKCFETVVHYGHYSNPKPHPEPLLVALERLKVKPKEAVYVGDTHVDFESARAAGVEFILFGDTLMENVAYNISSFSALPCLVEKINEERKI